MFGINEWKESFGELAGSFPVRKVYRIQSVNISFCDWVEKPVQLILCPTKYCIYGTGDSLGHWMLVIRETSTSYCEHILSYKFHVCHYHPKFIEMRSWWKWIEKRKTYKCGNEKEVFQVFLYNSFRNQWRNYYK